MSFSTLDFRLGFRMLVKYPGLTIVGGVAIAFAIAVSAVAFEFMMHIARPSLRLPGDERIVALRLLDTATQGEQPRATYDFARWRDELTSFEELGAYTDLEQNLIGLDRDVGTVQVARMSASGFRIAGVAPLKGRVFAEDDARADAPPVVVIDEQTWRSRLGGDPDIIGRTVRLGTEYRTVVGVMPEGFEFPLYHSAWTPLQLDAAIAPGQGPAIRIVGKLEEGVSRSRAQAELSALGARIALENPETHARLRPQVTSFAASFFDGGTLLYTLLINGFMALFLVLIFGNVGLLMFARTATRESEIIVRNALGASRGRIMTQLFAEALVLGIVGAIVGLAVARVGLRIGIGFIEGEVKLPFWFREGLSATTVAYVVGATLFAALVTGVLPALRVTRGIGAHLRAVGTGGGGLQFSGVWTVVIVAQLAFTVVFFALLINIGTLAHQTRNVALGFPRGEYLSVQVLRDDGQQPAAFAQSLQELERRLVGEPGVSAVTFAAGFPGGYHVRPAIELEQDGGIVRYAQTADVDHDFFDAMQVAITSGRNFNSADVLPDARTVIVNEAFVRVYLGGGNAVGRRVRYLGDRGEPGEWHEIVGVGRDLVMWVDPKLPNQAGMYHAVSPANMPYFRMLVHGADPGALAPRLSALAAEVDPAIRIDGVKPLEAHADGYLKAITFWLRIMAGAGSVALLLSLAGMYSVTAFIVSRRTREIGVRIALGSSRRRVLAALFSRSLLHVGIGISIGSAVLIAIDIRNFGLRDVLMLCLYAVLMTGVCTLACVVPARRALRVEPTVALRAEA